VVCVLKRGVQRHDVLVEELAVDDYLALHLPTRAHGQPARSSPGRASVRVAGARAWYQFSSDSRDLRYSLRTSGSADCRHTALYTRDALPWRSCGSSALAVR